MRRDSKAVPGEASVCRGSFGLAEGSRGARLESALPLPAPRRWPPRGPELQLRDGPRRPAGEPLVLLGLLAVMLAISGVSPKDRLTWLLEEAPVFIGVPILVVTFKRFRLTSLSYRLIFLHAFCSSWAATTLSPRCRPDSGFRMLWTSRETTMTVSCTSSAVSRRPSSEERS
jgi:hypothetical protein